MSEVIQAITQVGFPIVVCLICFAYIKYTIDKNTEQMDKITSEHKAEVAEMTKAIENNTIAITKLVEKLGE